MIARKYDGSKTRKPGRPKIAVEIEELILRMARANPRCGYTRIRGALLNLGHEVEISGIAQQPDGQWMKQVTRNLTDVDDGFLNGARYLIHDRDPLSTRAFGELLKSSGVETVKLPVRSPDLNAYAERSVRSIKSACLAQIIPLGERHLREAVKGYTEHYHSERNHQGLDYELMEKPSHAPTMGGAVECQERLGGALKYNDRRAE